MPVRVESHNPTDQEPLHSVVVEPVNTVSEKKIPLAYDLNDEVFRIKKVSELLTESEKRQLLEQDLFEGLVAHLAEVAEVEVYPYELAINTGNVGSMKVVHDESGRRKGVFKGMRDMLQGAALKFPDNKRTQTVKNAFAQLHEPILRNLRNGDTMVYFSPPDDKVQYEGSYGFMYLLQKRGDTLKGHSVKVEWEKENYLNVLASGKTYTNPSTEDFYDFVMNKAMVFQQEEISSIIEGIDKVGSLGLSDETTAEIWFNDQIEIYGKVKDFVANRANEYIHLMIEGETEKAQRYLKEMQLDWLQQSRPQVYQQVQNDLYEYGSSFIDLACGLLDFSTRYSGFENMMMMGIELPGQGFKCPNCFKNENKTTWIRPGNGDWCPGCNKHKHEIARLTGTVPC